jgi:cytochrome c oxidase subunit 1
MSADHIHPAPTSIWTKYIFTVDHKVIAKQFLFLALFFLAIGGTQAMLIRWTLAHPNIPFPVLGKLLFPDSNGIVTPETYGMLFTMHGTIMIFFAITPLLIGCFGNLLIPLMIGARDMIFPTLNMLSFWTMFVGSVLLLASFFVPMGAAAGGWTVYPTLSTNIGQPGLGQSLWCLAIYFAGTASIMGSINYITTVIRLRAPGMGYADLPMTVWGIWLTSVLNALFVPVIAAGLLLLVMDRHFGTQFYLAGSSIPNNPGDPILFQHLFWIFGHPEVYILILPGWGIVSDLLSFFARKPAFGAKATVMCMTVITVLSAIVYGHHMMTTGMTPILTESFMMLTMLISIPSAIFFLNWLGTLWRGNIQFTTPMLWALGVVIVFGLGGLTGLYHAGVSSNIYLHDSYFVVGHFHLTMAASVLFSGFAGIVFWFPKMFGRMMNETLGKIHFAITLPCVVTIFCLMLIIGNAGMHRRIYDPNEYEFLRHLAPLTKAITHTALLLGLAQFIFVFNFFWSLCKGTKASNNPWKITTLEWTISSPPPYYNFEKIPYVYNSPWEYGHPDVKEKDWLGQDEPSPHSSKSKEKKLAKKS